MKLPNRLAINTIYKGLNGLNDDQFNILNDSISASPQNVVKLDTKKILKESTDRTFSVRLMKWVEPYNIGGIEYSLFYTEVDHNLKVGDRVFIIGGYYDSDDILENSTDPYFAGVDGYRVLYVDRTKIVLDIEYVGIDPTNEEPIDNFIKVYVASTQYEFDYFLQALSMRDDNGNIESKFLEGYNNFLYLNGEFEINPGDYDGLSSFLLEDATTPLIAGNGFFIRNSSDRLQEITTDVLTNNNIISLLNSGYNDPLSGFFNILKIRVMNGRFFAGSTEWKRDFIYYYNATHQKWMVDRSYTPTILTKSNFRGGLFHSGEFNQGLYGHYDERLNYDGTDIKWTLGTTLNVNWKAGTLGSDHYFKDSNFTVFDRTGLPQIRANAENNGGAGYNYVFDTDFEGGDVINGNIFNLSTFYGTMSSESALDNYYTGTQTTYSVTLSGGVYYNSDILFADISNVTLISSYVVNSIIRNSKAVNSEIVATAFLNSLYLGDNVIKIQAYEESNILWYDVDTALPPLDVGVNYKMYKFYVTESSFLRLRELQYFYFKDIIVNLPNTDLLNFFDDKFQIGHWTQTFDTIGQKQERQVLVQLSTKEENRNSPGVITTETDLQPNFDNTLPSIDVFIEGGEDFNFQNNPSYPRPFIAETVDITNAYILEGDFVSGLFKDSIWVSGNYINYNKDYHFVQNNTGVYDGQTTFGPYEIDTTSNLLKIKTPLAFRPNIIGTQSYESNIVYINSVYYDSTLNTFDPGQNLVRMPDTFRILSADDITLTQRDFVLQDVSIQSTLSGFNSVSNGGPYFTSRQARNRYNYIHPVKFENSQIRSGLFRGAYFENCTFTNFDFDVLDKDLEKVIEKRNFLVSDVILDDNSNSINSGIFQYSHFLAGSDQWNSAIFHKGIWSESTFTYSFSPSFSTIFTREPSKFKNGVFRESEWQDGIFENGIFYKNRSNQAGTSQVISGTTPVYYTDTLDTKWSWQRGTFENGDFEKSNFETGLFEDGNFFNSDFLTGEATGGNFGKKNIPFDRSRVWTGTFSNVNVINAEFRTEHPTGAYSPSSIVWNSGIFNSGIFGVQMDGSSPQYVPAIFQLSNTWYDGTFNGGDFTDVAEWKAGTFNGGRFRSFYWYEGQTPYELSLATGGLFSWQSGKFNNGEFGRADRATNSTWFSGEFNGGKFNGRYWRDGVFTRGNFEGHAASFSTDINNYNDFIASYTTEYYGYWQTGWVSEVKDKFLKDQKIWTEVVRESTKKRKRKTVEFKDMLWYSGTFSHTDGDMINSVWLDGSHQKGLFYESVFNPYINLALPIFIDGQLSQNWDFEIITLFFPLQTIPLQPSLSNGNIIIQHSGIFAVANLPDVLQPGVEYTFNIYVNENTTGSDVFLNDGTTIFAPDPYQGFYQGSFIAQSTDFGFISAQGTFSFSDLVIYPGTVSGFRTTDSCIWENGKAFSSDFYFSKWKQGKFSSYANSPQGNAWGLIFEDGISDYMNAYNVFWGKGIWKNGNWNGSPFNKRLSPICEDVLINGDFETDDSGTGVGSSNWEVTDGPNIQTFIQNGILETTFDAAGTSTIVQDVLSPGTTYNVSITIQSNSNVSVNAGEAGNWAIQSSVGQTGFITGTFTAGGTDFTIELETTITPVSWFDGTITGPNGTIPVPASSPIFTNYYDINPDDPDPSSGTVDGQYGCLTYNPPPGLVILDPQDFSWSIDNMTIGPSFVNTFDANSSQFCGNYQNINQNFLQAGSYRVQYNGDVSGSQANIVILDVQVTICDTNDQLVYPGFASDIINNIASYATQSGYQDWESVHMNHTFTLNVPLEILDDPELDNGFGSGGSVTAGLPLNWGHFPNSTPYPTYNNFLNTWNISFIPTSSIFTVTTDFVTVLNSIDGEFIFNDIGLYEIEIDYFVIVGPTTDPGPVDVNIQIIAGDVQNNGIDQTITETVNLNQELVGSFVPLISFYGVSPQKTATFTYNSLQPFTDDRAKLRIRKQTTDPNTFLFITNISVKSTLSEYDEPTNNELWQPSNWVPSIGATISLPNTISYETGTALTKFGNGSFRSGIWENGVWNEGWRDDQTTLYADDLFVFPGGKNHAFRTERSVWTIKLNILRGGESPASIEGSLYPYQVGDRVSVGNVVAIDVNDRRRLIRNYMTITAININNINNTADMTLTFETTFPIRRIEKDSEEHIIHISKNVWLNGVFLNGKFLNGVWSNGLFQGFPYVTEMEESQWIDGQFKGGAFRGFTASYVNSQSDNIEYHTGLIQKFVFSDENVSYQPKKFKFNSWIDVNYFEDSGVNINKINETYAQTPLNFATDFIENNFYGYPTKDVLESVSSIRNGFDLNSRTYKLGWKFKEYQDWIPYREDQDQFTEINDLRYFNYPPEFPVQGLTDIGSYSPTLGVEPFNNQTINFPNGAVIDSYGIGNLTDNGWIFKYGSNFLTQSGSASLYGQGFSDVGFGFWLILYALTQGVLDLTQLDLLVNGNYVNAFGNRIRSNYFPNVPPTLEMERKLIIGGGKDAVGSGTDDKTNFTLDFIDNSNVEMDRLRYSFVEITGQHYTFTQSNVISNPIVFYNNYPATYSAVVSSINFNGSQISVPVNQIRSETFNKQREYFFNKKGLEVTIFSGSNPSTSGRYQLGFDSIRVVETDMIPFFLFATDCIKRVNLTTWGESDINWEDAELDPPGDIEFLPSSGIPTWDNFYLFESSTADCISYVNQDVQVPYIGKAPDIDFSNQNFDYVSSANIQTVEIQSSQFLGTSPIEIISEFSQIQTPQVIDDVISISYARRF